MSLLRNFATVGGATLVSRVLGFARDVFMAALLGTGPVAEAFFVALRLPNLFRRIFAEGAFNAAFVPLFSRALSEDGEDVARRFAEEVLAALLVALMVFTILAELAAPLFVYVLAPGFSSDPAKFDLTTLLTRITFPYLLCMSLTAMIGGMLNALGRFALAAFASSLLNVGLIGAMILIVVTHAEGTDAAGAYLSWGVFASGFLQLAALAIGLRRTRFPLRLRRPRWTPGVKRLLVLGVPGLIAGSITQINIVVGTIFASLQDNAVGWLGYADRLYQLPLGVVGVAIGVVLLPDLTRRLRSETPQTADHAMNRAIEFAMALSLPAAVALMVVPVPIIAVLFERGLFDAADTRATAAAVAAYAAGLPSFVLIKVLQPGFFAREDTRTPMVHAAVSMIVNVGGAALLFPLLGHVGIAVASSLAGGVNAVLLAAALARRGQFRADPTLTRRLPMLLVASIVMGAALIGAERLLGRWLDGGNAIAGFAALAALVAAGAGAFALACVLTGAVDLRQFAGAMRRPRRGGAVTVGRLEPGADGP